MELACPICETQFFVADNAIGPNGRKVRCSACAHVWDAKPAQAARPAAASTPAAAPPAAKPAPPKPSASDDEFHWPASAASESATSKAPETAAKPAAANAPAAAAAKPATAVPAAATPAPKQPPSAPAPAARTATQPAYSSPLEAAIDAQPAEPRSGGKRMVLGVLLLVFVGLTYGLRDKIVEVLPKAAPLYAMAGIPVGTSQSHLSVTDIRFTGIDQSGKAMVRVTGLIVNGGSSATSAPMLEVTLTDTAGAIHSQKTFDPQLPDIAPNQPARFEYDITGIADNIAKAQVKLVAPAE